VTSIVPVDFGSQIWPADEDAAFGAATAPQMATQASGAFSRDAQIPDLATTSSGLNQLQSLASAAATSAMPVANLPSAQQQTQAQQAAAQPPLKQDFYADGDDAE